MAPNAQSSSVLSAGSLPHLAIVDKLSEYPIVNSAIGYANDRYAALKSSHHLVNSTLDRAEKSLQLVVNNGVVPVLNKLEQPIHYADNIAVQGLDLAVAKINVISKQSEELTVTGRNLVGQTRQAVEQTAESVKERLVSVKTSTVQTVQAKVQSVLAAPSHAVPLLDQILAAGEHVLDYLLPEMKKAAAAANGSTAAAEEAVPANPDTKTVIRLVISRMRRFSEKVQKRIIDYGRDRWVPLLVEKAMSLKDGLVLISPLITSKLLSNGHAASSSSSSSTSPVTSNSSSPSSKTAATAATTSSSSSTPPKTGGAASASTQLKMLKLTSRVGPKRLSSGLKSSSFKVNATIISKKFQSSLNSKPNEVYTKLSDSEDPKRHQFFQYTWGSWMKNDQSEKSKRETKFSIEGITKLLQDLNVELKNQRNIDKSGEPFVKAPSQLKDGSYVLTQNLTSNLIGKEDSLLVKSIASIHEGKHNRIYKVTLSTGKELVLRIPYKLESEYSISQKIKSEVATMDFLNLKLGANVPKVVAYGANKVNSLQSPFILMEHIEGDLLMKQWDPLVADETEGSQEKLKSVIEPIAAFQEKLLSITFNKFGSLYFNDDVSVTDQSSLPYNGEENPLLTKRWRIGPSVEKSFSKNKNQLSEKEIKQYSRSIDADKPLETITSIAGIELENLRNRLALAQADSGNKVENVELIQKMIATFENLKTMSTKLFNPNSQSLMNAEELFKPRLYCPDLDPLNVILNSNKNNEPYFVDFEYTSIKPFILSSYPSFVGYQGAKIYNLEEDIPGYSEMDEVEKQQYQFMYYKTRNERLWELELNSRKHDLIAVASPHVKVLKSPYVQALDFKNDKDYLYIEGSIVQLQAMWEAYVANELCNATETEFPIAFTAEYLDEHQKDIEDYQMEIVSTPFAATSGWVPQDMFDSLKEQGIIVETENGDFKVETENVLKESE